MYTCLQMYVEVYEKGTQHKVFHYREVHSFRGMKNVASGIVQEKHVVSIKSFLDFKHVFPTNYPRYKHAAFTNFCLNFKKWFFSFLLYSRPSA